MAASGSIELCISTVQLLRTTEWSALGLGALAFFGVSFGLWISSAKWVRWPWAQWLVLAVSAPAATTLWLRAISPRPILMALAFGVCGVVSTWLITNYRALRSP